jgi:hypothetical protein
MVKYQTKKRKIQLSKKKRLIKGKKTHTKTIKQNGGVNPGIITISNNGTGGEPGLSQQCIWISIRDYLHYHRGETHHTVRSLKASVGLDPRTDTMEFDNNNRMLQNGLEQLCRQLCIRGVIIFIERGGIISNFSFDNRNNRIVQTLVYNQDGVCVQGGPRVAEDVYIASFGRHFEVITEIPGYYILSRAVLNPQLQQPQILPSQSKPKVLIHNVYVNTNGLQTDLDKKIADLRIKMVEKTQNIDVFTNIFNENDKEIKKELASIESLKATKLTPNNALNNNTEKSIKRDYFKNIYKLNKQNIDLKNQIITYKNELKIMEYEVELALNQENIEHFKKQIDLTENKILSIKEAIKELNSHIVSMRQNKVSNAETKQQMEGMYLSDIEKLNREIEEIETEKVLYLEKLKEFEIFKEKLGQKIISKKTKGNPFFERPKTHWNPFS